VIRIVGALAGREIIRFLRQPNRVAGSIGQPLLFWLFLGSGFSPTFDAPGLEGVTYMQYFLPGVLMMLMLFASIFSSITIIEDRDQGFLQGVLVAPVPRVAIVLGKVGGGAALAVGQSLILLVAAPFVGLVPGWGGLALILGAFVLSALGFTTLGFAVAWGMRSTSGFHAVMMVFLMPLWLLSGALFPVATAPGWLYALMIVNPVTHALRLVRLPFHMTPGELAADPAYLAALAVTAAWLAVCLGLSVWRVRRVETGVAPHRAPA